jgi:hypothetical protein
MCPDCHVTLTAPATSGARSSKRCDGCSKIPPVPEPARPAAPATTGRAGAWAAPLVEWLTCRRCTTMWAREATRGRKAHFCPRCSGRAQLPEPTTPAHRPR